MKVTITSKDNEKVFNDSNVINIGTAPNCHYKLNLPFELIISLQKTDSGKWQVLNTTKSEKVLFIWFSHYHNTADDVLLKASKQICEKFGKNIDFLIIEHSENVITPIKNQIRDNIIKYNVHTLELDDKGYPTTQGYIERSLPIFKQYSLYIPWYIRIKKNVLRIVSDIVCAFLFFSKKRGKIKQFIRGETR